MEMAIDEARKSQDEGEYAVGAVIIKDGEVLSKAGVHLERDQDATSHAEMNAIREACKKLNSKDLTGCVLYTTHEPCPMCTGAGVWSRLKGIVYATTIADMNAHRIKMGTRKAIDISAKEICERGDPVVEVIGPFMREECLSLF